MAAGFGIVKEQIHFFEERILGAFEKIGENKDSEEIFVDKKMSLDEVNWDNYKLIEKLAPFGAGNPKPLFLFENLGIDKVRVFGKTENHLELVFTNSKKTKIKAIDFFSQNIKDKKSTLVIGQKINILANFEKNIFGGNNELRLRIVEII